MTVEQLLSLLHDLPIDSLNKRIYLHRDLTPQFDNVVIVPVIGDLDTLTVVGYMIADATPVQLVLPFDKP